MTQPITNEDILKALLEVGGGLHREFQEFRAGLAKAATSINDQKFEEAKLLARQLEELSAHINNTKKEIALMRDGQDENVRITSANFELDAIVKATEDATNNIMDASERIQTIAEEMKASGGSQAQVDAVNDEVARIFEHCAFQDITGQRINKVVKTLSYIETRIENMIAIWGANTAGMEETPGDTRTGDASLLNGPQLDGKGVSQNDIDRMFG